MIAECCVDFYHCELTQALLGESFHPGGLSLTHQLANQTLVNRKSVILDVAAGKGTSANYLAQYFGATCFATDKGIGNLLAAQKAIKPDKVHIVQSEASHLPFASESFDVVFCECALCTFDDRERALTEIYRVLKPRGYIAISDIFLNEPMPKELESRLSDWLCISGALNSERSQQIIEYGGFRSIRFKDVSEQLLETIHDIEARLLTPSPYLNRLIHEQLNDQQADWHHGIASRLAKFIYYGGAGYYTLTARKPA